LRNGHLGQLGPAARGIVYQLEQGLGTVLVADAQAQLRQLETSDRSRLGRAGIKLGRRVLYAAPLLRPEALSVRRALCQAFLGPGSVLDLPSPAMRSIPPADDVDDETYAALGFPVFGGLALRADEVESLAARIAGGLREQAVAQRLGCDLETAAAVHAALGQPRRRR
jgi:ATP-dependent RNA helicase SUPV3L1/SUV3